MSLRMSIDFQPIPCVFQYILSWNISVWEFFICKTYLQGHRKMQQAKPRALQGTVKPFLSTGASTSHVLLDEIRHVSEFRQQVVVLKNWNLPVIFFCQNHENNIKFKKTKFFMEISLNAQLPDFPPEANLNRRGNLKKLCHSKFIFVKIKPQVYHQRIALTPSYVNLLFTTSSCYIQAAVLNHLVITRLTPRLL